MAVIDFFGAVVPPKTWRYGLVWGGAAVPIAQRAALERIAPWFTRIRIERLVIPFLRRRPAGAATDAPGQSAISLRTLDILLMHMVHAQPFAYRVRTPREDRVVLLSNFYRNLMASNKGAGVDAVRRQARSYVTSVDGMHYPTTIPQLTFIRACWCDGVIHVAAMFLEPITAWKAAARRDHRIRKAAAAGGRTAISGRHTAQAHRVDANALPILFEDTGAPEQYDVVQYPERALPPSQTRRAPPQRESSTSVVSCAAGSPDATPLLVSFSPVTTLMSQQALIAHTAVRSEETGQRRERQRAATSRAKRARCTTNEDAELYDMAGGVAVTSTTAPRICVASDVFSSASHLPTPVAVHRVTVVAAVEAPTPSPQIPVEDLRALRTSACAAFVKALATQPLADVVDASARHTVLQNSIVDEFVSGWS